MQLYSFGNTEYRQVIGEPLERRRKQSFIPPHQTNTCSKSKIVALEKGVKYSKLITKTPKRRH